MCNCSSFDSQPLSTKLTCKIWDLGRTKFIYALPRLIFSLNYAYWSLEKIQLTEYGLAHAILRVRLIGQHNSVSPWIQQSRTIHFMTNKINHWNKCYWWHSAVTLKLLLAKQYSCNNTKELKLHGMKLHKNTCLFGSFINRSKLAYNCIISNIMELVHELQWLKIENDFCNVSVM